MEVTHNDIVNALAKAEDVAYLNAQSRSNELSNGCKPSKADNDKAIEIESWIQLLTRAKDNTNEDTCLEDDIIWEIIQNVNELYREVDCTVSRTYSRSSSSGGGGNVPSGYVERVLGVNVDNSNPSRPVIEIFVDPLTISGDGTQADPFSAIGGGGGATNLGYTASPTDGIVTSSTGTDATLPLADGTNAGLLKPSHFSVLENGNQADGYVGTDANNEMFSSYYDEEISRADLINDLTANLAVGGKFYRINDAVGSTIILLVIAESNINLYSIGTDITTGEQGTYDITTDVFTPIVVSGTPDLQQVTTVGSTTSVGITVDNGLGESIDIKHDRIKITNASGEATITSPTLTTATEFRIPDKPTSPQTFAMLSDVTGVPYTGATADVDLGIHRLTANTIGIGVAAGAEKLHIDGGATTTRVKIDADNGVNRILSFRTDDVQRWALRVDGAESGSNIGADFQLRRYNDAGAYIDSPIAINRANGNITTSQNINGATPTELGYLSGVTTAIQTQINALKVENLSLQDGGSSIAATTYTLELYAQYAYTINQLKIISASGTCTVAVKINGVDVTGISAVSVSSTIATANASAANTVAVGDKITLVTTSNSALTNLQASLKTTRI
jgi:hypothetical protein